VTGCVTHSREGRADEHTARGDHRIEPRHRSRSRGDRRRARRPGVRVLSAAQRWSRRSLDRTGANPTITRPAA
jgi:hypothetical protein